MRVMQPRLQTAADVVPSTMSTIDVDVDCGGGTTLSWHLSQTCHSLCNLGYLFVGGPEA